MALPRKGFSGVDSSADMPACRNSMAEWGTLKGWAKAWNADPQVICQGAMYVTMNCSCISNISIYALVFDSHKIA